MICISVYSWKAGWSQTHILQLCDSVGQGGLEETRYNLIQQLNTYTHSSICAVMIHM